MAEGKSDQDIQEKLLEATNMSSRGQSFKLTREEVEKMERETL